MNSHAKRVRQDQIDRKMKLLKDASVKDAFEFVTKILEVAPENGAAKWIMSSIEEGRRLTPQQTDIVMDMMESAHRNYPSGLSIWKDDVNAITQGIFELEKKIDHPGVKQWVQSIGKYIESRGYLTEKQAEGLSKTLKRYSIPELDVFNLPDVCAMLRAVSGRTADAVAKATSPQQDMPGLAVAMPAAPPTEVEDLFDELEGV